VNEKEAFSWIKKERTEKKKMIAKKGSDEEEMKKGILNLIELFFST